MKDRGKIVESIYSKQVVATIHPSAVLRAVDSEARKQLREFLKHDLALAMRSVTS
jgi:DNA polymerase